MFSPFSNQGVRGIYTMNKVTVIGAGNVGATVAECVARKDMASRSSRLMPGRRGMPAVITQMSEPAVVS